MQVNLYGGIEGGGTKFACIVARNPQDIIKETRFPTTTPGETMERVIEFFLPYAPDLAAIGFSSFGPLDLNPVSPTYGHVTATPKPGWSGVELLDPIRQAFHLPIAFELDVNAAAYGEWYWVEENRACDPLIYYTIGTGIGAGIVVNGRLVHGLVHPEAGHMRIPHDWNEDSFPGVCPFHGDCFEGLATGPSIAARWKIKGEDIPDDHPAWALEAEYIAEAMSNTIYMLSPQRIVLGGGVMQRLYLFPMIHRRVQEILNGYIASPVIMENIETLIIPPALGSRSGVLGAIALAISLTAV
jgi:fructokinase